MSWKEELQTISTESRKWATSSRAFCNEIRSLTQCNHRLLLGFMLYELLESDGEAIAWISKYWQIWEQDESDPDILKNMQYESRLMMLERLDFKQHASELPYKVRKLIEPVYTSLYNIPLDAYDRALQLVFLWNEITDNIRLLINQHTYLFDALHNYYDSDFYKRF